MLLRLLLLDVIAAHIAIELLLRLLVLVLLLLLLLLLMLLLPNGAVVVVHGES